MKQAKANKFVIIIAVMLIIAVAGYGITVLLNKGETTDKEDKITIVASCYPVYIATINVTDGMDNVEVIDLMGTQQGCIHDYQLTTDNMRTLETADVLLINGAGMEPFLDDIETNYANLPIVDSSEGITLLANESEHDHDHDEDADHDEEEDHDEDADHEEEHDHGEYNAHVWLDPARYQQQIDNIAAGLASVDADNADTYKSNADAYKAKVAEVEEELKALPAFDYTDTILFHNSMEYLTGVVDLTVDYCLNLDDESSLSAGEVANVVEEVKEHDIKVLFSEEQFDDSIVQRIAEETGANVYTFDSLVTGDGSKDSYLTGMRSNIELFKTALYK